jgi:lysylphosphatidylglycerol synthetase-like protein (DUF2156 family)
MRLIKGSIVFGVAFAAAWVIIFTFMQTPFQEAVPARLLWHQTPPYPIYYYLIGAFVLGLLIGSVTLGYSYVTAFLDARRHKHEAREARERAEQLERQVENMASELARRDERPAHPEPPAEADAAVDLEQLTGDQDPTADNDKDPRADDEA